MNSPCVGRCNLALFSLTGAVPANGSIINRGQFRGLQQMSGRCQRDPNSRGQSTLTIKATDRVPKKGLGRLVEKE